MPPSADLIITGAKVFTADKNNPTANAVAVKGDRILFVGSNDGVKAWCGPATRIVDGGNCTLMPGFIDCHFHLLMGSLTLDKIHYENCFMYEDVTQAIQAFAVENPAEPWLTGFGLRYNLGPGNTPLTRQNLDAILPGRPVVITAYDGHTTWTNTPALRTAGIFHGGECPPN